MLLARRWRSRAVQLAAVSTVKAWRTLPTYSRPLKTDARINVVHGVAGSGKTRYLVKKAAEAIKNGQTERLLILTKVRMVHVCITPSQQSPNLSMWIACRRDAGRLQCG
jgi:hypothetical protein